MTASFHILSNSLYTNHPIIRRNIIWAIESVVKYPLGSYSKACNGIKGLSILSKSIFPCVPYYTIYPKENDIKLELTKCGVRPRMEFN
jgi:hypothetical protein